MNISLRLLRYVVAAADCGNVTEASRRLQVSQPSVSAAIAELEQMLGVTIFVRHHAKGVTVTSAGQKLIQEARLLLKHASEFSKTAEALGDTSRGEIVIGCFPTLAARFMPSLMQAFNHRFPMITLNLEEGDQEHLFQRLAKGEIEMAICYDLGIPPSLEYKPLFTLDPVVTLAADHRLAGAPDVSLLELADEPYILYDGPHSRDYLLSIFEKAGVKPNIALRLHSFELIRGLVARGHGYALHAMVPLTNTTYDGGQVVVKPLRDRVPPSQIVAVTASSQMLRPAVHHFLEFVQESFREEGSHGLRTPVAA